MTMLDELLCAPSLSWTERKQVECILGSPGCWPHDPALRTAAEAKGFRDPGAPAVGETLLVAVTADRRRTTLLRLRRVLVEDPLAYPQGPEARAALSRAAVLAPAHVPLLVRATPPASAGHRELLRLLAEGPGDANSADGSSFGLAMVLAAASEWLRQPSPADLIALAAVDDTGRLGEVCGLEQKLAMVRHTALGVKRVVVCEDQRGEAMGVAESLGGLEVVALANTTEALALAFASLSDTLRAEWASPDEAASAAGRFLELALTPPRTVAINWSAVANAASLLRGSLPEGTVPREKAAFSASIASRHAGDTAPLAWPSDALLDALPSAVRLRCVAHGIQSAGDAGHDDLRARVDAALGRVTDTESRGCLELLGAIGRSLAAMRQYEAARDALERAVAGWVSLHETNQASFALSELLRVCGVLGDAAGVDSALRHARAYESAYPHEAVSISFLRWAAGRALLHTDRAREASALLDGTDLGGTYPHVRAGVIRARVSACARLGDTECAARLRRELATIEPATGAKELAALDAALDAPNTDDAALEVLIDAFVALRPQGVHGLLGPGTPRERAERLAREYPY
jgi:hypothetical protein